VLAAACGLSVSSPALADCSGGAKPTGKKCGSIPVEGCCDGETLYFCEGGELCELSCGVMPHCGWSDDRLLYECETAGMADPAGKYGKECSLGGCPGVDYVGCCSGETVVWCDGTSVQSLDCSGNPEKNRCGWDAGKGVADCVGPDAPGHKSCGAGIGDAAVGGDSTGSGDGTGPGDAGGEPPVDLDGLVVPDLHAPASCHELAWGYDVSESDCGIFGKSFQVKADGCAALLVGLVPSALSHPAAKVTQSGMVFTFTDAGTERQCTGQFNALGAVAGNCYWDESSCLFRFEPSAAPATPDVTSGAEVEDKPGGGCDARGGPGAGQTSALVLFLCLAMAGILGKCATRLRR
jgi:hypothetical protein